MDKSIFTRPRIDCILIWGHGIPNLPNILKEIRNKEDFEILKIEKYRPKNMRSFVKEMYAYDYAPFWHLKSKTRYLLKTTKEVCFIFIKNLNPCEDYLDEGNFRHRESMTLKQFKEKLRDKFNPYENGQRTHNHIIHATDCEEQTEKMLKYLGYKEGTNLFSSPQKFIDIPYYLKDYRKFHFKQINMERLFCKVIVGQSWENFSTKTVRIEESPQYLGLTENIEIYENYINKYLGGALQEDYNLDRYIKVHEDFNYLQHPNGTSFVLVEKVDDKFIILDGLHRSCAHLKNGNTKIKVCQLTK